MAEFSPPAPAAVAMPRAQRPDAAPAPPALPVTVFGESGEAFGKARTALRLGPKVNQGGSCAVYALEAGQTEPRRAWVALTPRDGDQHEPARRFSHAQVIGESFDRVGRGEHLARVAGVVGWVDPRPPTLSEMMWRPRDPLRVAVVYERVEPLWDAVAPHWRGEVPRLGDTPLDHRDLLVLCAERARAYGSIYAAGLGTTDHGKIENEGIRLPSARTPASTYVVDAAQEHSAWGWVRRVTGTSSSEHQRQAIYSPPFACVALIDDESLYRQQDIGQPAVEAVAFTAGSITPHLARARERFHDDPTASFDGYLEAGASQDHLLEACMRSCYQQWTGETPGRRAYLRALAKADPTEWRDTDQAIAAAVDPVNRKEDFLVVRALEHSGRAPKGLSLLFADFWGLDGSTDRPTTFGELAQRFEQLAGVRRLEPRRPPHPLNE